ncbi:MAG: hypothetical protein VCF24_02410 [Candidatus Latescibacterota bacterium]
MLNPWNGNRNLPITYQVELDFGSLQRSNGRETRQAAFYQEINWAAYNGIILLLAHDWSDPRQGDHRRRGQSPAMGNAAVTDCGSNCGRPLPRSHAGYGKGG